MVTRSNDERLRASPGLTVSRLEALVSNSETGVAVIGPSSATGFATGLRSERASSRFEGVDLVADRSGHLLPIDAGAPCCARHQGRGQLVGLAPHVLGAQRQSEMSE